MLGYGAWEGRQAAGRDLVVLTAVAADELATPSPDPAIGNPFTHAVSTALRGAADGFDGRPVDGNIDMAELTGYVLRTAAGTIRGQEHTPQHAGEHLASDIMASYSR